jgi:hypothetical protein
VEGPVVQLLEEYFPYFIRESLIRDVIVFNFQGEGQPLRAYIGPVFRAAGFLEYDASEQQLVDRVVMNFHPGILAHAAFLDKPRSLKDLYRVVGLIEEKFAVAKERQRVEKPVHLASSSSRVGPWNASRVTPVRPMASASASAGCWTCRQSGHFRRNCPPEAGVVGKRADARRPPGSRAKVVSGLRKISAVPRDLPLWVNLELKVGKVPALIDTGAQFSCI